MAVRLDKPWIPLQAAQVAHLPGHLGVYQLADSTGEIVYIGVAGGRSAFGLKGALQEALQAPPAAATQFRYEVNMAYHTRHLELLQAYHYDHGRLPVGNLDIDASTLGRLRLG
ncbi:MAG: hypothetical protein FJZ47_21675 [Candidatus Tectomicrobia bacterium]|uniref:DUF7508 domain-containing protein n=1 Tax=Tectimicrobiota bacterium TaxID=2528274 RepID=A0A937W4A6_UNCTE|nr:hypothetical protein [Candidatus Tectomicrobia bacterium]